MKAAAEQYFGKALPDLTLAEAAILAAIPRSPTRFDLVKNAEQVCLGRPRRRNLHEVPARRPAGQRGRRPAQLHRPDEDPEPLGGKAHSLYEYEAAKEKAVKSSRRLAPQAGRPWKAPRFVLAGPQRAGPHPVPRRGRRRVRGDRHRRLPRHLDAEPVDAGHDREVGLRDRPRAEHQRHRHDPQEPRDPHRPTTAGSKPCAARTSTTVPPR